MKPTFSYMHKRAHKFEHMLAAAYWYIDMMHVLVYMPDIYIYIYIYKYI